MVNQPLLKTQIIKSDMTGEILVTTRSFRRVEGQHKEILREAGYELIDSPHNRPLTAAELRDVLVDMDGAILGVDDCNAEALSRANRLKVISRFGIGIDKVDLETATQKGIVVTNTPGANSVAVAELAIALMFALARNIPQHHAKVVNGDFSPITGTEITGSVLGLIGLGRIGLEVAKRANALGMTVLYRDPMQIDSTIKQELNLREVTLKTLLAESDFVSLHLPLLDSTKNMIDASVLEQMKTSAFLINTARGGLVDEQALYDVLHQGKIAGAGFDTFQQEPPTGSPLLTLENFIATPHTASATLQTTLKMGLLAAENALAVLQGERPEHVVNPEVYELMKERP